jgi:hypothetical protein
MFRFCAMSDGRGLCWIALSFCLVACGTVEERIDDGGSPSTDAGPTVADAAPGLADADLEEPDASLCEPGEGPRCEDDVLVQCGDDGIEQRESCSLGCSSSDVRCYDIEPSNNLAQFLDASAGEPEFEVSQVTIDTTTGEVLEDGVPVEIENFLVGDASSPPRVRVYAVGSLKAGEVTVSGDHALAIVSNGDIVIEGHVSVSANGTESGGPGAVTTAECRGGVGVEHICGTPCVAVGGAGGGGFGTPGARGGDGGTSESQGGVGGGEVGSPDLLPLRGGCDGGEVESGDTSLPGRGGGALQLVSRSRIIVAGALSANGGGGHHAGAGSGGAILLEAPRVVISGVAAANGGGGGCRFRKGLDGRRNAIPADGAECPDEEVGDGGSGAAGAEGPRRGEDPPSAGVAALAGSGGGGAGRIRINVAEGGLETTGTVSPEPSIGAAGVR